LVASSSGIDEEAGSGIGVDFVDADGVLNATDVMKSQPMNG
jgi:hypothetical protein